MSEENSLEMPLYSSDNFKSMDANNDNFVTTGEMADFLKKETYGVFSDKLYKSASKDFIKSVDIDDNGKMSLGEFAFASMGSKEINRADFEAKYGSEETTKFFDQYDTNKDGKVSQDEIKEVDKANDKSNGLSVGAIIGIVIGAVCLVGLIIGLIVYLSRNKKKAAQKDAEKSSGNNFDNEMKNIGYKAENNPDSVNRQKNKDKSVGV